MFGVLIASRTALQENKTMEYSRQLMVIRPEDFVLRHLIILFLMAGGHRTQ